MCVAMTIGRDVGYGMCWASGLARDMPRAQVKFGLYCTLLPPTYHVLFFQQCAVGCSRPVKKCRMSVHQTERGRPRKEWLCDQTCRSQDVPCAMPEGQVHPFPGACPTCTPMNWSCAQIKDTLPRADSWVVVERVQACRASVFAPTRR